MKAVLGGIRHFLRQKTVFTSFHVDVLGVYVNTFPCLRFFFPFLELTTV